MRGIEMVAKSYFARAWQNFNTPISITSAVSAALHLSVFLSWMHSGLITRHAEPLNSSMVLTISILPTVGVEQITLLETQEIKKTTQSQAINPEQINTGDADSMTESNTSNDQQATQAEEHPVNQVANQQEVNNQNQENPFINPVFSLPPEYPPEARWESRSGSTILQYRITSLGEVTDVEVIHTSGHQDLDWSAIQAIKQWRYQQDNINPLAWYQYTFHFKLE